MNRHLTWAVLAVSAWGALSPVLAKDAPKPPPKTWAYAEQQRPTFVEQSLLDTHPKADPAPVKPVLTGNAYNWLAGGGG